MVAAPYISGFLSKALPYLEHEAKYTEEDRMVLVGSYTGMRAADAKKGIAADGLSVRVIGDGDTVIAQSPAPDTALHLSLGSVILYTTNSTDDDYVAVPALIGLTAEEANRALLEAGLNVAYDGISNYYIGKESAVTAQSAERGLKVRRGTVIHLRFLHTDDKD